MNIEFQTAGLLISLLLFIIYTSKKRLNLYSEKIFFRMILVSIFLFAADIASIIVITNQESLPQPFVNSICRLYVSFLVLQAEIAMLYILVDILGKERHRKISRILFCTSVLQVAIVFILPINNFSEGRVVYTYGPCTNAVYFFCALYILISLFSVIFMRKKIFPRRRMAFLIWMCIWISAMAIQFMNNQILLVSFAVSLGLVILYIMLENPEANIDVSLGCLNALALEKYIQENLYKNSGFYFAFTFFEKFDEQYNSNIHKFLRKTNKFRNVFIFKDVNLEFFAISKNKNEFLKFMEILRKEHTNAHITKNYVLYSDEILKRLDKNNIRALLQFCKTIMVKNGFEVFTKLTDSIIDEFIKRQKILDEIHAALDEDRLEVFLQPIYSTERKRISAAEALVRLRKVSGELLYPANFIPIAEESGLIIDVGERVFEKTCKFIAENDMDALGLDYIEINLSVLQCEQDDLALRLSEIMEKHGVPAQKINLEITESGTLNAKKNLLKNMKKLISRGCSFSLDDFGKGESNLMYIVEMPVSIIKLDYDMSKAFFRQEKAMCVVTSIVQMAHKMNLSVVAEGIETKEEMTQMSEMGIDYIQGFYFSKPVPENLFLEYLKGQLSI